jgi:nitrate reductase cytochrome c-type subunit
VLQEIPEKKGRCITLEMLDDEIDTQISQNNCDCLNCFHSNIEKNDGASTPHISTSQDRNQDVLV